MTSQAYGFQVDRLFSLLMELRDHYGEMMLAIWKERFENVFNEDNYTPIYLQSADDIDEELAAFPFDYGSSLLLTLMMRVRRVLFNSSRAASVVRLYAVVVSLLIFCRH